MDDSKLTDSGIEIIESGAIIITGDGIDAYQNLTIYHGLQLEVRTGLRMSRSISAHQAAKRKFGLKGSKLTCLRALIDIMESGGWITADEAAKDRKEFAK